MIPTSTNVSVDVASQVNAKAQALAVFITEDGKPSGDAQRLLDAATMKCVHRLVRAGVTRGKPKQIVFDLIDMPRGTRRIYVIGLGKKAEAEAIRQAAGALAKAVQKHRIESVNIVTPANGVEAVVTGLLLAAFEYEEYKGTASRKKTDDNVPPKKVAVTILSGAAGAKAARQQVERSRIIADSQNFARTIAHRPGNDINPPALAKVAQDMAKQVGLKCRVMDEKELKKLGMGGILAVGAGSSATPPRMIILEHKGKGRGKPLLLVGKAITFDTGGISIKPAEKMGKMVFDKCGAMAVLGAMCAIAKLKLPMHVVGILSSAENHISELAYRPGDILRMYNGVTVEVTNTDAEGRLVLGDALSWGIETYKPAAVVDLATLTGGVVVALGRTMAGVMSNSDDLVKELTAIGQTHGEKIWPLPLGPEQREQIKSDDADIVNSAGREGHPLQGGAFLSYFVPDDNSVPWAHLDIAGVADTDKELPYYRKGATGWGVRTLVEWATRRANA